MADHLARIQRWQTERVTPIAEMLSGRTRELSCRLSVPATTRKPSRWHSFRKCGVGWLLPASCELALGSAKIGYRGPQTCRDEPRISAGAGSCDRVGGDAAEPGGYLRYLLDFEF